MKRRPGAGADRSIVPPRGQRDSSSRLHEERLDAVMRHLRGSGAASVVDLGCGSGSLLARLLADTRFTRIVGIDSSAVALSLAERLREGRGNEARLSLVHGSLTSPDEGLTGFDAATLVEAIEHIQPAHLSRVERAVFQLLRPGLVIITTPNQEYNALLGRREGEVRHADHRFEWSRARFESWAGGVGVRNGYGVEFEPVGAGNVWLGSPSQMAIFRRRPG